MNQKTKFVGTGTEIAALTSGQTWPGMSIFCTLTGSGFNENVAYTRNKDNTAFMEDNPIHRHDTNFPASGGWESDIGFANVQFTVRKLFFRKSEWYSEVSGAGTVADTFSGNELFVDLDTGTTANGWAQIRNSGIRVNVNRKTHLRATVDISSSSNVIGRWGVAVEPIADTNTGAKKIGIEFCDSTGSNLQILSADGTTRSVLDSGKATDTIGWQAHALHHDPNVPTLDFYYSTDAKVSKTTNLPITGVIDDFNKFLIFAIKTTSTVTKEMAINAVSFSGHTTYDAWSGFFTSV